MSSSRALFLLSVLLVLSVGVSGQSQTAVCPASNVTYITYPGQSFPGNDLWHIPAANASVCMDACCATEGCQAYTLQVSTSASTNCSAGASCCYLKYQVQDPVANTAAGTVSGVINGTAMEATAALYDVNLFFALNPSLSNHSALAMAIDISLNLAELFNVSASFVQQYVRVPVGFQAGELGFTYLYSINLYILANVYAATGFTSQQLGDAICNQQYAPGVFIGTNTGAVVPSQYGFCMAEALGNFGYPLPAVLGQPVYDAQISLPYVLTAVPTGNNFTEWLAAIKMDIAVNAAFMANLSDASALLPFISIQSPAIGVNPAFSTGVQLTLEFTLSAAITTVTGPYWTPDVLQQGFSWMADEDEFREVPIFLPFTSGIVVQRVEAAVTDLPPHSSSSSTGGSPTACQVGQDVTITMQAQFDNLNATYFNASNNITSSQFLELVVQDISYMLVTAINDWNWEGRLGSFQLDASLFSSYIQLQWPFVSSTGNQSFVGTYSPSSANTVIQLFANKDEDDYFYIKFNLLSTMACVLPIGVQTSQLPEMLFNPFNVGSYSYTTPYAQLEVLFDEGQAPSISSSVLSGMQLCPSTVSAPSCTWKRQVNSTGMASSFVSFSMSLGYSIVSVLDFNSRLTADIVRNFPLLGSHSANDVLPYITITYINSAVMSSTVVQFEVMGSINSGMGLIATVLAESFATEAGLGNLTLPNVQFYYGVSVAAQTATVTSVATGGGGGGGPALDSTGAFSVNGDGSSSGSSSAASYPADSEAIVFYVIIGSLDDPSEPGAFTPRSTVTNVAF